MHKLIELTLDNYKFTQQPEPKDQGTVCSTRAQANMEDFLAASL